MQNNGHVVVVTCDGERGAGRLYSASCMTCGYQGEQTTDHVRATRQAVRHQTEGEE